MAKIATIQLPVSSCWDCPHRGRDGISDRGFCDITQGSMEEVFKQNMGGLTDSCPLLQRPQEWGVVKVGAEASKPGDAPDLPEEGEIVVEHHTGMALDAIVGCRAMLKRKAINEATFKYLDTAEKHMVAQSKEAERYRTQRNLLLGLMDAFLKAKSTLDLGPNPGDGSHGHKRKWKHSDPAVLKYREALLNLTDLMDEIRPMIR